MTLTVSLAQMQVIRNKPLENLEKGKKFIETAKARGSDLIVFPEMWTTGFDWDTHPTLIDQQAKVHGQLSELAKKHQIWISGSLLCHNAEEKPFNTQCIFSPNGSIAAQYSKMHLFSYVGEDKHLSRGKKLSLVEFPWGKCGLSICYDIRFPELFRSLALKGATMFLCPAAFPHPRLSHFKILTAARAIENQCFFIATNQVGTEEISEFGPVQYFGHSCIIDPWGEYVVEGSEEEELLTATIDVNKVSAIRSEMSVFNDRHPENY